MLVPSIGNRYAGTRRPVSVHIVGDTGTGKSTFLASVASGPSVDAQRPTSGILHASSDLSVSSVPTSPRGGNTSPVSLAWTEWGAGNPNRDFFQFLQRGGSRSIGSADVLGVFFSARSSESLKSVVKRWLPAFRSATSHSILVPFVFVVESHCETIPQTDLDRDRRIVDIAMRRVFGPNYIFFQVDARSAKACMVAVEQIAVQTRHQARRETGSVHIVSQNNDVQCCGLIRAESAMGELLADMTDHPWCYYARHQFTSLWRTITRRLPCGRSLHTRAEIEELDEADFVAIL